MPSGKRRGRPFNPNIAPDMFPCTGCSVLNHRDIFGVNPATNRPRRLCPKCVEKKEERVKNKITVELGIEPETFDINKITQALKLNNGDKTGTTIGIFGQSKIAGKTTLLKKIINIAEKDFDFILLFTVNTSASIYEDLRAKKNVRVIYKFDPTIVNVFHKINGDIDIKNRLNVLFVLDDEIDSKLESTLRNMILTYRNMNISTVICSQAYSIVDKKSRGNFNFVFLGAFKTDEHIKDLVHIYLESFAPVEMPKKHKEVMLTKFYREKTKGYNFLVLDNVAEDYKLQIYKA